MILFFANYLHLYEYKFQLSYHLYTKSKNKIDRIVVNPAQVCCAKAYRTRLAPVRVVNIFRFEASKHSRNENYQIWTHDNHAEEIYTNKFIDQKIEYIHNNPVKAGIVFRPEDYLYSSARDYCGEKGLLEVVVLK